MPIVINELVFRGEIGSGGGRAAEPASHRREPALDHGALVERCVEEVLRVLELRRER